MAKVITLSRRSSRSGEGRRKGSGRIKDIVKDGYFNIKEFGNWLTGFKSDEVAQSSAKQRTTGRYSTHPANNGTEVFLTK